MENIKFGDTKEIILNKLKYSSRISIPINSKLNVDIDDVLKILTIQLDAFSLHMKGETLFVPENFWQHFKHEVFPNWLIKISPIRYCKYEARQFLTNYAFDDSKDFHSIKVIERIDEFYSDSKRKGKR